jgi:hypothetical protein
MNSKITPLHRARTGVQPPYTFDKLKFDVQSVYNPKSKKTSLRGLAETYRVSHAVIARILAGYEPKAARIRLALGLPALKLAPACPLCGEVHVAKRCTRVKSTRPRFRHSWKKTCIQALGILWGQRD